MVYFRVDDKLHSHPKMMQAGVEAMGLWVVCGSWCADQLTDGWVPEYLVRRLTPLGDEYAAQLVNCGLWVEAERGGVRGWSFHEWTEWGQPSKAATMKSRADVRDRVARHRRKQRGEDPSREDQPISNAPVTRYSDVSNPPVTLPPYPYPYPKTNQDLITEGPETLRGAEKPRPEPRAEPKSKRDVGTRIPDDFAVTPEMVEWARTNAPHVDGRYETAQFVDYWRSESGARASKKNWTVTWYRWMRKAEHDAPQTNGASRPAARSSKSEKIDRWQALKTGNATRALPQREPSDDDL